MIMLELTNKTVDETIRKIYDISLKSAQAKEKKIYIYEKSNLSKMIGIKKAEELRKRFLKNNIKVQQITNIATLPKFSKNDEFLNNCMIFRYIPKETFTIYNDILIFDNTVAFYDVEENIQLTIIENKNFATNQKQLFLNLWEQGQLPKLRFEYKPNHSFYNSIDFHIQKKQIIVWPDADAKDSYKYFSEKELLSYIKNIILSDKYYNNASYIIAFIWSLNGEKMVDMWKFNDNHIDDRSGPLGNVKVYRERKACNELGLASGNTLLVLGYEEKLRRQSKNLKSYLNGPIPKLPMEIMNGKDFFKNNK